MSDDQMMNAKAFEQKQIDDESAAREEAFDQGWRDRRHGLRMMDDLCEFKGRCLTEYKRGYEGAGRDEHDRRVGTKPNATRYTVVWFNPEHCVLNPDETNVRDFDEARNRVGEYIENAEYGDEVHILDRGASIECYGKD